MSALEEPELLRSLADAVQALGAAVSGALNVTTSTSGYDAIEAMPRCAELRFGFVVSVLYKLYRETVGEDLKFLNLKIGSSNNEVIEHYNLVNDLRTFEQHEVQSNSPRTLLRRERCRLWFDRIVGLRGGDRPMNEAAWNTCVNALLAEAIAYLNLFKTFIVNLESPMGEYIKKEWLVIRTRTIPVGEFDRIAYEIAADLGMGSRDIVAFRNQHRIRINDELRGQRSDVDIPVFMKQAITKRLLEEGPGPILIADDLMQLGVKPGIKLGEALREGQRVWVDSGHNFTKSQVIERLRKAGLI